MVKGMVIGAMVFHGAVFAQLRFDPETPRPPLWDNRQLTDITLPPALPEGNILYLPSVDYYKLKSLPIYKTYSVYDPGHEPQGYFDYLRQQERRSYSIPKSSILKRIGCGQESSYLKHRPISRPRRQFMARPGSAMSSRLSRGKALCRPIPM
jgi:hypothetical protein